MAESPPAHGKDIRRVVLFTAVPSEMSVAREHLPNMPSAEVEATHFGLAWWDAYGVEWEIIVLRTDMGNRTRGPLLERARMAFRPQAAFFAGVAGQLKDVEPGDVVIGSSAKGYALGKEINNAFFTRAMTYHSTYLAEQIASQLIDDSGWYSRRMRASGRDPKVVRGIIASGDVVLADDDGQIREQVSRVCSDAVCVEMEGLGFLEALRLMPSLDGLVVRGISDCIGNKAALDRTGFQKVAADAAIALTLEVIARYGRSAGAQDKTAYGRILFDGRRDLQSVNAHHRGNTTSWSAEGEPEGPIGSGTYFAADQSTALIRRLSRDGRYELHIPFKGSGGTWQRELPPPPVDRQMRRIRLIATAAATECEHSLRIVLADRDWGVVNERRIKVLPSRPEEVDITLVAPRRRAVYLRLDDEEVQIQPSDLRLSKIVVIEER
jgi:adenosylhomocysteine nucleosidase